MISQFMGPLLHRANQGILPYLFVLAHIALGAFLVYTNPRSNLAFLVLISSLYSLYACRTDRRFQLITGMVLALLIIPVLGGAQHLLS